MSTPVCPRCGSHLHRAVDGAPLACPTCTPLHDSGMETRTSTGEPPSPPAQDFRGRAFGHCTILEEISRGAMGVVYKARQHGLDRIVALKVLLAGDMATEAQVARFQREAQAAARLHHPAIVPVHEVGIFEGKHYYTMDYIEGKNLGELIRAGEVSTRRALDIAAEVAEALEHAHAEGIIHRDIKPGNIMIDPRGHVHILDFGLAKQLDSDTRFTRTGTTIGTPAYMPPEQASGESPRVDHRADIYSLGAVLYELLTGQPPFTGDTMMNTLMRVLNDEPVAPKKLNARIHRDIQTIVLKAMEKSPERRYPTMRALADDIRRFIAGESISARPASLLRRTWRCFTKHRSAVFALVAVAAIALAAYVTGLQMSLHNDRLSDLMAETGKPGVPKGDQAPEEEKATFRTVFDDDFSRGPIEKRWQAEKGSPWKAAAGRLEVAADRLAAIHTREKFAGNVIVAAELSFAPGGDAAAPQQGTIGCFLGSDWPHSYRVSLGGKQGFRLALMNEREQVAEVECPRLPPEALWLLTLERTPIGVRVVVESESGDVRQELAYNELTLPRQLGREFAAGIFGEGARLRVRRFRVRQELPPLMITALQAADDLFRDGNFSEASNRFQKIAEGYEGSYEGLAALFGTARCHAAERRYKEAVALFQRVEALVPGIQHERLPALLSATRLDEFFASASLNNFPDAAKALCRIAASGGNVEAAWVWHFPKHLADLLNNRAYDETLEVLRAAVFGPNRQTLYGAATSLPAPALQDTLATRARELAEALCDTNQPGKVRAVYEAYPTPKLADAFARAARGATRREQRDEALSILAFCSEQKMSGPSLGQAAVELANSLCAAGQHPRVAEVYRAMPEPQLGTVFLRAINETTARGKLDDALALLRISVKDFPAMHKSLLGSDGPALRLGRAFVARGEVLEPITIQALFAPLPADPPVVALFVEATQKALADKKPDDALRLLEHSRARFGLADPRLAAAAAQLVAQHAAAGDYKAAVKAYDAYPNEALAPTVAKAVLAAAEAGRLGDALTLFGHYARNRGPIPPEPLRRLADAIAALDPQDEATEEIVGQYRGVFEIYDSPVARSTLALALGDAYVRGSRLREALAQYEAAGDAEGLLRAACLALETGQAERAATLWRNLRDTAGAEAPAAAAAAFMLRESTAAEFAQAAARAKLSPALTHYLLGLRLWAEADARAVAEFALAASDPLAWLTPLARRAHPEPAPAEEPPKE